MPRLVGRIRNCARIALLLLEFETFVEDACQRGVGKRASVFERGEGGGEEEEEAREENG